MVIGAAELMIFAFGFFVGILATAAVLLLARVIRK
jgi:hypothetical protein